MALALIIDILKTGGMLICGNENVLESAMGTTDEHMSIDLFKENAVCLRLSARVKSYGYP